MPCGVMWLVPMSSDKHSASPRHSHSSPSTANAEVSCAVSSSSSAALCSPVTLTSAQPSQLSFSCSQSSHVLNSAVERLVMDDDTSLMSMPFEDKDLWHNSFGILYEFYQTGTFCDVEIHVGSQRINCHRLVLACFSQYFRYCTLATVLSSLELVAVG